MSAAQSLPVNVSTLSSVNPVNAGRLSRTQKIRVIKAAVSSIVALAGLAQAWTGAYFFDPDGVCYLDVGGAFARHHWMESFNSYWSPLYAWALGIVLNTFRVPARWELPVVHGINAIIYLFDLWCFNLFLREALKWQTQSAESPHETGPYFGVGLWLAGNGIFLWCSLALITVWGISPDLLLAGFIYLIATAIVRISHSGSAWSFAALGFFLGLSYWCKAVMFPLSILFLAIAWFASPNTPRRFAKFATSVLVFVMVAAPLVCVLSKKAGRFTFGDSGWLNYSSYVSPGGRVRNWQGYPPATGVPRHPTRKIFSDPDVFEFSQPIGGTYPPSYDPPYWNAGRQWTFDLKAQTAVVARHLTLYINLFLLNQPGIVVGVLTLLLCGGFNRSLLRYWPLLAISACAFGTYMLVHAEYRFFGAYIVLVWMALLLPVKMPAGQDHRKFAFYVLAAVAVSCLLAVMGDNFRLMRDSANYSAFPHLKVAHELDIAGIHPGAHIAVIGNGNFAYYAHFDRAKIMAEIMQDDTDAFWTSSFARRKQIYAALDTTDAIAVVARPPLPLASLDPGWLPLGQTTYYVRWLRGGPTP